MPRKLPWETNGATNVSRPKKPRSSGIPAQKRQRMSDEQKDDKTASLRSNENERGELPSLAAISSMQLTRNSSVFITAT
jgi:hypothetical protein